MDVTQSPAAIRPGGEVLLRLKITDPVSGQPVRKYSIVHEKLMHLFLVSEDLQFFAHVHPEPRPDGTFELRTCLPKGGMYRLLADYYPTDSVPQLSIATIFVDGKSERVHLSPSVSPIRATNLTAALRTEPENPIAGLETRLFYSLDPFAELQPYLGAWGHMLIASEDLIDLIHTHPFLADAPQGKIQFNAIFPRPACYRIWTQFQRSNTVNTVAFNIVVRSL